MINKFKISLAVNFFGFSKIDESLFETFSDKSEEDLAFIFFFMISFSILSERLCLFSKTFVSSFILIKASVLDKFSKT